MSYCIVSHYPETSHPLHPYAAILLDKAAEMEQHESLEAQHQEYALVRAWNEIARLIQYQCGNDVSLSEIEGILGVDLHNYAAFTERDAQRWNANIRRKLLSEEWVATRLYPDSVPGWQHRDGRRITLRTVMGFRKLAHLHVGFEIR